MDRVIDDIVVERESNQGAPVGSKLTGAYSSSYLPLHKTSYITKCMKTGQINLEHANTSSFLVVTKLVKLQDPFGTNL